MSAKNFRALAADSDLVGHNLRVQLEKMIEFLQNLYTSARSLCLMSMAFDRYSPLPNSISYQAIISGIKFKFERFRSMGGCDKSLERATPEEIGADKKRIGSWSMAIPTILKQLYTHPEEFVIAFNDYFTERPTEFPLFVNLTFPAIYGFFLTEELTACAQDFMHLVLQVFEPRRQWAFLGSFFGSSHLFLKVFWRDFFVAMKQLGRVKPSTRQLCETILKVLQGSLKYLSSHHIQIAMELLDRSSKQFAGFFFERFLLGYFDTWVEFHPSISTSKVTHTDIKRALVQLTSLAEQESSGIPDIFRAGVMTHFEPIEWFGFITPAERKYIIVLSRSEASLLINVSILVPSLEGKTTVTTMGPFLTSDTSLNGYLLDVYPQNAERFRLAVLDPLIFPSSDSPVTDTPNAEYERHLRQIGDHCRSRGVGSEMIRILGSATESEPTDTFFAREVKKLIAPLDEAFLDFAYDFYGKETKKKQRTLEEYFTQQIALDQFNELNKGLRLHVSIMRQKFVFELEQVKFVVEDSVFADEQFRNQMCIDESNKCYCEIKTCGTSLFDQALHSYTLIDPDFQSFILHRREFVTQEQSTIDRLDELALGGRFYILGELLRSVNLLCDHKEHWIHAVLCEIFSRGRRHKTLFSTFIGIFRFETTHADLVKDLSDETKTTLSELHSFFQVLLDSFSSPDDEGNSLTDEINNFIFQAL
jgi:hypothetical protein